MGRHTARHTDSGSAGTTIQDHGHPENHGDGGQPFDPRSLQSSWTPEHWTTSTANTFPHPVSDVSSGLLGILVIQPRYIPKLTVFFLQRFTINTAFWELVYFVKALYIGLCLWVLVRLSIIAYRAFSAR
jgi:hypothetical protein